MHELITLSFGNEANHIAAATLEYEQPRNIYGTDYKLEKCTEELRGRQLQGLETNPNQLFREIDNSQSQCREYTPRALFVEWAPSAHSTQEFIDRSRFRQFVNQPLNGMMKRLVVEKSECENENSKFIDPYRYEGRMEDGDGDNSCNDNSSDEEEKISIENELDEHWKRSSYGRMKNENILTLSQNDFDADISPLLWNRYNDDIIDRIRHLTENCDNFEGFLSYSSIFFDDYGIHSSIVDRLINEYIADEFPNKPLTMFDVNCRNNDLNDGWYRWRSVKNVNSFIFDRETKCSVFHPISIPSIILPKHISQVFLIGACISNTILPLIKTDNRLSLLEYCNSTNLLGQQSLTSLHGNLTKLLTELNISSTSPIVDHFQKYEKNTNSIFPLHYLTSFSRIPGELRNISNYHFLPPTSSTQFMGISSSGNYFRNSDTKLNEELYKCYRPQSIKFIDTISQRKISEQFFLKKSDEIDHDISHLMKMTKFSLLTINSTNTRSHHITKYNENQLDSVLPLLINRHPFETFSSNTENTEAHPFHERFIAALLSQSKSKRINYKMLEYFGRINEKVQKNIDRNERQDIIDNLSSKVDLIDMFEHEDDSD
ncbi:hypothetical protein SNEBB_007755 [Seison nebaliae]|nr:hypothetical protein SNEBB_007755 [Seison nebaliae]